jgi:conjugal transfer pilus assembly protein TrbC
MQAAQGLASGPGLLIFVSLSMPRPTLARLIEQAARARAAVILRGFINGSLRDTVAQVQTLIGAHQVAVQIDPQAFDRFAVTRVPSFVLVRDGTRPVSCAAGSCAPPGAFLRTAGDVSLNYALEHMQGAAPAFRTDAHVFLTRLKP